MASPEGRTEDRFETQFGVNHLGHFLFFQLLKDTMLSSSTPIFNSRVINVSSMEHLGGKPDFQDLNLTAGYDKWASYSRSKTAK